MRPDTSRQRPVAQGKGPRRGSPGSGLESHQKGAARDQHNAKPVRPCQSLAEEHEAEYRDQNGELVVTARGVGVRTERPVEQPAAKKEEA